MYYDYQKYWVEMGKKPNPEMNEYHKQQEVALGKTLHDICFDFNSVLEFGAGWGRITRLINKYYNLAYYTAVDISKERLYQINGVNTVVGDILNDNHLMKHDLVLAVELLLHIPPDKVKKAIDNMKSLANKYVISIDYYPNDKTKKLMNHNFIHDYPELYGNAKQIKINNKHSLFLWKV